MNTTTEKNTIKIDYINFNNNKLTAELCKEIMEYLTTNFPLKGKNFTKNEIITITKKGIASGLNIFRGELYYVPRAGKLMFQTSYHSVIRIGRENIEKKYKGNILEKMEYCPNDGNPFYKFYIQFINNEYEANYSIAELYVFINEFSGGFSGKMKNFMAQKTAWCQLYRRFAPELFNVYDPAELKDETTPKISVDLNKEINNG